MKTLFAFVIITVPYIGFSTMILKKNVLFGKLKENSEVRGAVMAYHSFKTIEQSIIR